MPIRPRYLPWMLQLVLLGGCCFPVREHVDGTVCELTARPVDVGALLAHDQLSPETSSGRREGEAHLEPNQASARRAPRLPDSVVASLQQPVDAMRQGQRPAGSQVPPIPATLPGANVKMLDLPPGDEDRREAIKKLFKPLPELGPDPQPRPSPDGEPWTLARLQQLALGSSPLIRQAAAAVQTAEGAAVQAGLPPNPNVGYEGDTMGTGGSAGYNGGYVEQVIKTAGKLKLAQAAAAMDVLNSRLALRKAQADLAYNIRHSYFAVLVARKNLAIARAMVDWLDGLFQRQVSLVLTGTAAVYEASQLEGISWQARAGVVTARNRYLNAWHQLAAAMGRPDLPLTELAGDIDMPVPVFEYHQAVQWILQNHTDVETAENEIRQARYNLRLAQVTPIPDVDLRVMVQKDNTTLPHQVTPSVVFGIPLPVWNRNQGGIREAQGTLLEKIEEPHRVRSMLVGRLAEAYRRYRDAVAVLQVYQERVIPNQVRAYLHTYERHLQEPGVVGFADIVVAQQQMAGGIMTYINTLGEMWTAVADIAHLLQTNDLYATGDGQPLPTWELAPLPELPCCHSCSPLSPPTPAGADAAWPAVLPAGIKPQSVP